MQRFDDHSVFQKQGAALAHPHLQTLETYWQKLRAAGNIPARTDLNPARIEHVLPYTFILQRVAPGTARFRVAGQRLHDLLKMDPRGMPFSTLFDQDSHDDLRHVIEAVCADPAIIGLQVRSAASLMRPALDGTALLLPMRDTSGRMTRILGAIVTPDTTSQKPRRFVIRNDVARRHDRLGPIRPELVSLMPTVVRPSKRPDAVLRPALKLVVNNG
jgi:hypothetical protein